MSPLLLPWTTRGLKYDTREYLASVTLNVKDLQQDAENALIAEGIRPDTPFTEAMPILTQLRGTVGGQIEYGCFDLNGMLIEDQGLLFRRQSRNILYYTIRDLFNLSRGQNQYGPGAPLEADPVPDSPEGNWAALLTEACPDKEEIESALQPLATHRSGKILTMPPVSPAEFLRWLTDQFNNRLLPHYLLICDTFSNIPLEYQAILNAFLATGRLWLDTPEAFRAYVSKVLAVEQGSLKPGPDCFVASPVDDDVTLADHQQIISPMLPLLDAESFPLKTLCGPDFNEQSLLQAARTARFLALYCHGVALDEDDWGKNPGLQGAFVLQYESEEEEGLLTPDEIAGNPFVPGGIVFSPACLGGGTQGNSDFAAWIDWESLAPYLGQGTSMSAISRAMLSAEKGPIAALAHFDISIGGSAPMYNPMTQEKDLQKELHLRFIRQLLQGQTLGKATAPFRWAAGDNYAQAIYIFGQITGKVPYFGTSGVRKTIGMFITSMNQCHVTATDMRNYIILGDPGVRLQT